MHIQANVLNCLPKSAQPAAKAALAEIYNAEDRKHALAVVKVFKADYSAKFPKAVAKITDHLDMLLEFYNYPAEHWIHLRITNPIESAFATVRLRQRVTKGPGSPAAGVAMAFAHRVSPAALARGERTTPGRPRPRWRPIRERQTRPTTTELINKPHDTPIHRS